MKRCIGCTVNETADRDLLKLAQSAATPRPHPAGGFFGWLHAERVLRYLGELVLAARTRHCWACWRRCTRPARVQLFAAV